MLISYPLHPPGKPDKLRVEHLPGDPRADAVHLRHHDAFGTPDELTHWTATMSPKAKVTHVWLEGKGHDLKGCDDTIAGAVKDFVDAGGVADGRRRPRG